MTNTNQIRDRKIVGYIEQINELSKQLDFVKSSFEKVDYEQLMKQAVQECYPQLCEKYPETYSNLSYSSFAYRDEDGYVQKALEIYHDAEIPWRSHYDLAKVDTEFPRFRFRDFRVDVQRSLSNRFQTLSGLEKSMSLIEDVRYVLDIDRKNKFMTKCLSINMLQRRRRELYSLSTAPIEEQINELKSIIDQIIKDDFKNRLYSTGLYFEEIGYEDVADDWRKSSNRRRTLPSLQISYHDYTSTLAYVRVLEVSKSGKTCTVEYLENWRKNAEHNKPYIAKRVRMSRIHEFLHSLKILGDDKVRQMPSADTIINEFNKLTNSELVAA